MIRVLVAEDHPDLRRSVGQMLADRGYDVVVVKSAAEALAMLDREAVPELALLDRDMPELDRLGMVHRPCERSEVVATYLLMRPARKQTPLEVRLLHAPADNDPAAPAGAGTVGLRLEIGKALVDSHRGRETAESARATTEERTKR
jgi:CheY-like chemotaxis protein